MCQRHEASIRHLLGPDLVLIAERHVTKPLVQPASSCVGLLNAQRRPAQAPRDDLLVSCLHEPRADADSLERPPDGDMPYGGDVHPGAAAQVAQEMPARDGLRRRNKDGGMSDLLLWQLRLGL